MAKVLRLTTCKILQPKTPLVFSDFSMLVIDNPISTLAFSSLVALALPALYVRLHRSIAPEQHTPIGSRPTSPCPLPFPVAIAI